VLNALSRLSGHNSRHSVENSVSPWPQLRFPVIRKKHAPALGWLGALGARFIQREMVLSDTSKPNRRNSP
jgi:hypothetical protein